MKGPDNRRERKIGVSLFQIRQRKHVKGSGQPGLWSAREQVDWTCLKPGQKVLRAL